MNRTTYLALVAEFGPIVLFFIAGQTADFFTAVAVLMGSTVLATILSWQLDKRIPWLPILSAFFVLLGGAITLARQAPDAIILADTLFYITVASTLGYSLLKTIPLLKMVFGTIFAMNDIGWRRLTINWFLFLLFCACTNEIARFLLTPDSWIEYRFYKTILVTCFASLQIFVTRAHRLENESNRWGLRKIT